MAGAGTSAIRSAAESFSMARVRCSRLQTHHRRGAENAELRRVDSHNWALLGEPRRSPRLIENKTLALRDHPHPNPLPHAGEGAMPDPSPAGEEGVLRGSLSRSRERAGVRVGRTGKAHCKRPLPINIESTLRTSAFSAPRRCVSWPVHSNRIAPSPQHPGPPATHRGQRRRHTRGPEHRSKPMRLA